MNRSLPKDPIYTQKKQSTGRTTAWAALIFVIVGIMSAAWIHIKLQPLPNQWDDSIYASATYDWLNFIHQRGDLLRGMFWGAVYALPHHLPPLVFVTSLFGALVGGESLLAMRTAHLIWLLILLISGYCIGSRLSNRWGGVLSALLIGSNSLVFFWSKTIMGEPSLFATVGLLLLAIVFCGGKPGLLRGILIGSAMGMGLLTKQHFFVSAIGPLGLWVLWMGVLYKREHTQRSRIVLAMGGAIIAIAVIATPWYAISYKEMIAYASQPAFSLHTLNQMPYLQAAVVYAGILLQNTGWPALMVSIAGLAWGVWVVINSWRKLFVDWKGYSIAILLSCALANLAVGFGMRNINTRFITPGFIPLGILAGMALVYFLQPRQTWRWIAGGILLSLNIIFWGALSFGFDLPRAITFSSLDGDLSPTDMSLTLKIFQTVESAELNGSPTLWIVGNYHNFNQPTFVNLVEERRYSWNVTELYHWTETDVLTQDLISRIGPGDWVAVYRQTRVFDIQGEELVSRLDGDILSALQENPNFDLMITQTGQYSDGQVFLFKHKTS